MVKEKYIITGMTCSACSARVQKAVDKLPGISKATVNLLTNSLQIEYDEAALNGAGIIAAVEKAGYGAALAGGSGAGNGAGAGAAGSSGTGGVGSHGSPGQDMEDVLAKEAANMRHRLIWSIVCLIPLMYIAMHHMLAMWFGIPVAEGFKAVFHGPENAITFAFAQFLLACPILLLNRKYFINGSRNLFHGAPNMDSLVGMGSAASMVFGIFAIFRMSWGMGHGDWALVEEYSQNLYFESAGMIVTLITVGKYLEARAKSSTGTALKKLMGLMPKTALVLRDGKEMELPAESLLAGDEVIVKPGGTIAADGVVLSGETSVDESAITGESIPVVKKPGDKVISATINLNGYIHFRAEKVGEASTISQIIRLVDEASGSKAPIAKIADQIAGIFVPAVIGIAVVVTAVWLALGYGAEFAFSMGISILVISCPCALGLATPVAIMAGTGKGAEKGILIKSGEALEQAKHLDTVVLDKTGTITEGKPRVTDVLCIGNSLENLLSKAASLEKASQHPLALAILDYAKKENVSLLPVADFSNVAGRGISGMVSGRKVFAGNAAYMEETGIDLSAHRGEIDALSDQGKTVLMVGEELPTVATGEAPGQKNGSASAEGQGTAQKWRLLGIFAVADTEKSTSKLAIQTLRQQGLEVIMLTGDNERTAKAVADRLGIGRVIAQVLPQDKERVVRELQESGKKVAMVGDGINDAPALARADVGIAIGAGTDIAMESADVVLVGNNLLDVADTISLSRAVIRNIKENLFWAFFYNVIGIPLAAGLLYPAFGVKLSPMIGAAAMSMSSVCVVCNALRLKGFKFRHGNSISKNAAGEFAGGAAAVNVVNVMGNTSKEAFIDEVKGKDEVIMTTELKIEGMMCKHCQKHVNDALSKMAGVTAVTVDLEKKTATVEASREISRDEFKAVITEAGYELV